jgi:hypothetical protein
MKKFRPARARQNRSSIACARRSERPRRSPATSRAPAKTTNDGGRTKAGMAAGHGARLVARSHGRRDGTLTGSTCEPRRAAARASIHPGRMELEQDD